MRREQARAAIWGGAQEHHFRIEDDGRTSKDSDMFENRVSGTKYPSRHDEQWKKELDDEQFVRDAEKTLAGSAENDPRRKKKGEEAGGSTPRILPPGNIRDNDGNEKSNGEEAGARVVADLKRSDTVQQLTAKLVHATAFRDAVFQGLTDLDEELGKLPIIGKSALNVAHFQHARRAMEREIKDLLVRDFSFC